MLRWVLALGLIGGAGYYAYLTGSRLSESRVVALEDEIETLNEQVRTLSAQNDGLRAEVLAIRQEAEGWRARYDQEIPQGALRELFQLLQTRQSSGVDVERLRYAIGAVENRRDCEDRTASKRLYVATPLQRSAQASGFAGGAVTMRVNGASARDGSGNPEAWFDPAQPVEISLVRPGGEAKSFTGVLPVHPVLIAGNQEYRFSVVSGPRGFVQVTLQRCAFP
jgi:hypothetical protein